MLKRIFTNSTNSIKWIFKSKIFRWLANTIIIALLVGIISGLLTTHLISRPSFSFLDMLSKKNQNSVDIRVTFQNTGQVKATNVIIYKLWAVGNIVKSDLPKSPTDLDYIEPGDVYSFTIKDIPHNNKETFIYVQINYSDESILRKFFSKILGVKYTKKKWSKYNPKRNIVERIPSFDLYKIEKYKRLEKVFDDPEKYRAKKEFTLK